MNIKPDARAHATDESPMCLAMTSTDFKEPVS
jgi:hypothetical protein